MTPEQALVLREQIRQRLTYFNRLCGRMRGWDPADPVYVQAHRARDEMQNLMTLVHYASCRSGVGREEQAGE